MLARECVSRFDVKHQKESWREILRLSFEMVDG